MLFSKSRIFVFFFSCCLLSISNQAALAKTDWSKNSSDEGWGMFVPLKGKPDFDKDRILGCGSPKKSYEIIFSGTPEEAVCQIGVGELYQETKRDIDFSKYDIHGTMRTKCADALTNPPRDIYVPTPIKYASWCPYSHPKAEDLKVNKPNNFIIELKSLATSTKNSRNSKIVGILNSAKKLKIESTPWRKGFSGKYPDKGTDNEPSYADKERAIASEISQHISQLVTAYLFSDTSNQGEYVDRIEKTLGIYSENKAFEYLFYAPFSRLAKKRTADGGEVERYDDYDVPDYWDASINNGLLNVLPGIINLYSILKHERPEAKGLPSIREYVQKLVWLTEQGLDYGATNKQNPMTPESANHHSAPRSIIHLMWGVADGDEKFFRAGVNHFLSVLQDSRLDGSISSEVKPSPSKKSTHGGWGSLDRNNETLGYHALGAILINSQGYDLNSISINGVNLAKNIEFGVAAFIDPSVADRWTDVKTYSLGYLEKKGVRTSENLSWYLLTSLMLGNQPNEQILEFITNNEWQGMARNLGLINVRYFLPMNEKYIVSNKFDGLTCGYQIIKRYFDKEKNKTNEYTINFGKFDLQGGQPRFGNNFWKAGGISLEDDYLNNSAQLFIHQDGTISGSFPVFTSKKKNKTTMVEIKRHDESSSIASESRPLGEFVAIRDGIKEEQESFVFRVNSCN